MSRAGSVLSVGSGAPNEASELQDEEPLAPWNFTWVIKRELAIMGYPKCKGNVRYLVEQNVGHLVSLSPEKQPPFELFPRDLRWTPLDVLEFEPPRPDQIQAFISICRDTLVSGKAIAVHCRMGKGRSGVMAACYMVYFYGLTPENAVTHVRLASPGCIETFQQEKAVKGYHDHLRSISPPPAPPPPTEEQKLQALYDKYNPDAFVPSLAFRPHPLSHPVLDKYSTHLHGCPTARKAKRTFLPHRTEERHQHFCHSIRIPPKVENFMYIIHRD